MASIPIVCNNNNVIFLYMLLYLYFVFFLYHVEPITILINNNNLKL